MVQNARRKFLLSNTHTFHWWSSLFEVPTQVEKKKLMILKNNNPTRLFHGLKNSIKNNCDSMRNLIVKLNRFNRNYTHELIIGLTMAMVAKHKVISLISGFQFMDL